MTFEEFIDADLDGLNPRLNMELRGNKICYKKLRIRGKELSMPDPWLRTLEWTRNQPESSSTSSSSSSSSSEQETEKVIPHYFAKLSENSQNDPEKARVDRNSVSSSSSSDGEGREVMSNVLPNFGEKIPKITDKTKAGTNKKDFGRSDSSSSTSSSSRNSALEDLEIIDNEFETKMNQDFPEKKKSISGSSSSNLSDIEKYENKPEHSEQDSDSDSKSKSISSDSLDDTRALVKPTEGPHEKGILEKAKNIGQKILSRKKSRSRTSSSSSSSSSSSDINNPLANTNEESDNEGLLDKAKDLGKILSRSSSSDSREDITVENIAPLEKPIEEPIRKRKSRSRSSLSSSSSSSSSDEIKAFEDEKQPSKKKGRGILKKAKALSKKMFSKRPSSPSNEFERDLNEEEMSVDRSKSPSHSSISSTSSKKSGDNSDTVDQKKKKGLFSKAKTFGKKILSKNSGSSDNEKSPVKLISMRKRSRSVSSSSNKDGKEEFPHFVKQRSHSSSSSSTSGDDKNRITKRSISSSSIDSHGNFSTNKPHVVKQVSLKLPSSNSRSSSSSESFEEIPLHDQFDDKIVLQDSNLTRKNISRSNSNSSTSSSSSSSSSRSSLNSLSRAYDTIMPLEEKLSITSSLMVTRSELSSKSSSSTSSNSSHSEKEDHTLWFDSYTSSSTDDSMDYSIRRSSISINDEENGDKFSTSSSSQSDMNSSISSNHSIILPINTIPSYSSSSSSSTSSMSLDSMKASPAPIIYKSDSSLSSSSCDEEIAHPIITIFDQLTESRASGPSSISSSSSSDSESNILELELVPDQINDTNIIENISTSSESSSSNEDEKMLDDLIIDINPKPTKVFTSSSSEDTSSFSAEEQVKNSKEHSSDSDTSSTSSSSRESVTKLDIRESLEIPFFNKDNIGNKHADSSDSESSKSFTSRSSLEEPIDKKTQKQQAGKNLLIFMSSFITKFLFSRVFPIWHGPMQISHSVSRGTRQK